MHFLSPEDKISVFYQNTDMLCHSVLGLQLETQSPDPVIHDWGCAQVTCQKPGQVVALTARVPLPVVRYGINSWAFLKLRVGISHHPETSRA